MDFKNQFRFKPYYSILICKPYAFAVTPLHLCVYIAKRHAAAACYATSLDPTYATLIAKGKVAATLADSLNAEYPLLNLTSVRIPLLLLTKLLIPKLILH
jgi:hypothetical protein